MKNLKQYLLSKKEVAPDEVARFIIKCWADEFIQVSNGIYNPEKVADEETLKKLFDKTNWTDKETRTAKQILDIKEWVTKHFSIASAHIQQAQGNLNNLIKELENIEVFENIGHFMDELPLIVTKSQYDRYKQEKENDLLRSTDLYNLLDIIESGVNYYVELSEYRPRKKNLLKELKKLYMKETIDHNHLIQKNSIKKWDFLKRYLLSDFYECFNNRNEENFKEFMLDFEKLYNIILEDILNKLQLRTDDVFQRAYTLRELYDLDLFAYRKIFAPSSLLSNNYNAVKNGVAIIKDSSLTELSKAKIDKNGDYIPPNIKTYLSSLGLNAYMGEEGKQKTVEIKEDYQAIKESYYFIQGYNRGLKIISDMYDLKDVEVFAVEQKAIEDYIKELNVKFIVLKKKIENSYHENKAEQQEKLMTLNKVFEVIHLEKLQTSKKNINEFTKILERMELSQKTVEAINYLSEWIYK